ncbi:uncharacterized protein LOC128951384 [Oppia nitens]|uniref:uncharacterized protein LOC128951384 n=1 Tax=Oppia nitens TaxID=1686743 RepID=UPI0023D9BF8B|nr:uncharacterized protein LOC128951384 [Oppia nitens]
MPDTNNNNERIDSKINDNSSDYLLTDDYDNSEDTNDSIDDYNNHNNSTNYDDTGAEESDLIGTGDDIDNNDDEEDTDYEANDEPTECSPADALRGLNISRLLPVDYESLKQEPRVKIVKHFNETWDRFLRAFRWEHQIYGLKEFRDVYQYLRGMAYELSFDIQLEPQCMAAVSRVLQALIREEIWAFKFFDSQSHPIPTGFWGGIITTFGEYDQCVDIKSPAEEEDNNNNNMIAGQYCLLRLIMPYPLRETYDPTFESNVFATQLKNFTRKYGFGNYAELNPILKITEYLNMRDGKFFEFGICIPDKCNPRDIENEFNRILYPFLRIPVEIPERTCIIKDRPLNLDRYQIFAIFIFITSIILVSLGTSYELYHKYLKCRLLSKQHTVPKNNNDKQLPVLNNKLLLCFSMITNTRQLCANKSNTINQFASINTTKLLVSVWLLAAHTYLFTAHSFVLKRFNESVPLQLFHANRYVFVRAKQLAIDTFMVASQWSHLARVRPIFSTGLSGYQCFII